MLDTWCFSTSCLRMPHMCSRGFMSGDILGLLQYVTVHVGIHVSLNEPQLPSTSSSSHAAPDHDDTTTMLYCRQDTILLILITSESLHMLDTIWVKQVNLRLIRPQDMVPVIRALGQVIFSKLFPGFFVSQLQKSILLGRRSCKLTCCSVRRKVLALTSWRVHFCNL